MLCFTTIPLYVSGNGVVFSITLSDLSFCALVCRVFVVISRMGMLLGGARRSIFSSSFGGSLVEGMTHFFCIRCGSESFGVGPVSYSCV